MEPFANFYRARLPDLAFSLRQGSAGMLANVDYLQSGEGDVTFTQSDIAYTALTRGTEANPTPHTNLRGLAVTWTVALHLVVGPHVDFHSLKDLQGKRVGIGPSGGGTGVTAQIILAQSGMSLSNFDLVRVPPADVPSHLAAGTVDAEFITGAYPADLVRTVLKVPGTRLVPIQGPGISGLKEKYPFLKPVVIPANIYGQAEDVHTVGVDVLFICRENLSEQIVYRMLTTFFDGIQDLAQRQPMFQSVSLSQAPATPIPLHPGAARFYRERELFN
jgi:TRAP transporter TAXI family solute receptor